MYLIIMNIATPIPKNVLDCAGMTRQNMVSRLAHSFIII